VNFWWRVIVLVALPAVRSVLEHYDPREDCDTLYDRPYVLYLATNASIADSMVAFDH
jgi:hypothetical protein